MLLLTMHHIVSDGWCMGVLVRELAALYAAFREGRASPLAGAAGAVRRLRGVAARVAGRARCWSGSSAYWQEQLAGAPALLELPTDRPRPPVQTYRGAHGAGGRSPPELLERLQALGRSEGATLFMMLLAAFQVLLSRYSGQRGRRRGHARSPAGRATEVEGLIGFFVNTLVLRTDLSGDPSFRELLRRVREATLGAYAHQDVPFEQLVEELQPERDLSHSPLFQVMFALQNAGGRRSALCRG